MMTPSRWIRLTGATNVRDLGGYTAHGGVTRWGALFRSDSLHKLTETDQRLLLEQGVRTIIDLRHDSEVEAKPNVFANSADVRYLNIPIFRMFEGDMGDQPALDLVSIYRYIVDECQAGVGETLTAIANAEPGAVLFHCAAGKDRTGVIAALLLRLVGVPAETVVEDFALTAEAMALLRPALLEQVLQAGGTEEIVDRLLASKASDMLTLLTYLDALYDGVIGYVRSLGLSDAQIDGLRARLLDTTV
ncbi:MAG: tyrosine-protein phosphatase [Chloroflexi bacterium]|nr:tyrosine-protein phosphatase [Chloroflexota bacterium]